MDTNCVWRVVATKNKESRVFKQDCVLSKTVDDLIKQVL